MSQLYLVPSWFYSYGIAFEIFFALATLLVAWYALKIYNISKQKELRRFGIGFLLISISYSIWAFMNVSILTQISEGIKELELNLSNLWLMSTISFYAHAIVYISGLVFLAYAMLKFDSRKFLILVWALCMATVLSCSTNYFVVYVISSVLIGFIILCYCDECRKSRNKTIRVLVVAFILLFVANIEFILAGNNPVHYVIRHILELAAYLIILTSLIKVIKHGEKKKPARNHP